MALAAQIFNGITPERFRALSEKVRQETGITVSGVQGQASHNGFTLAWKYTAADEQLLIQCLAKPFIVPGGAVLSKVRALVESV